MKTLANRLLLAFLALAVAPFASADNQPADEAAIRKLEVEQQEAWNKHDAKAYAELFTADGDCVNVVGWWWKGRAEIEKKLSEAYAFVFAQSVLTIAEPDVRFLSSDLAVVHARWTMTGARTPQGLPTPQQGIQTQLLQKRDGKWLIVAFQNTNSLPEMPFPKGPAPAAEPAKP